MGINLHYFELCAYSESLVKLERKRNIWKMEGSQRSWLRIGSDGWLL
jgi:hypothetical protein